MALLYSTIKKLPDYLSERSHYFLFLLAVCGGYDHCASSPTFTTFLFMYYRGLTNISVWQIKWDLILISICIFLMSNPRFFLKYISICLLKLSVQCQTHCFYGSFQLQRQRRKWSHTHTHTSVHDVCRTVGVHMFLHVCRLHVCHFLAWLRRLT